MPSKLCSGAQCCHAKLPKLGADNIVVLVGTDGSEEEVPINADLAKQHSGFLDTELKTCIDASQSTIRLPKHSAQHFRLFVAFVCTGHIYSIQQDTTTRVEVDLLADLWALGQSLKSISFKDAVTDAILHRRLATNLVPSDLHETMAEHLQTETGVGKLLVDIAVAEPVHKMYTARPLKDNPNCLFFYGEFVTALDKVARGVESKAKVMNRSKCEGLCIYHEHDQSGICYRSMFPAASDNSPRRVQSSMPNLNTIIIEFHVGSEDVESFIISKYRVVRHSKLFKRALNPKCTWKEANENIVRLPEQTTEAFQVFVTFVNAGCITLDHCWATKRVATKDKVSGDDDEWCQIAQLWIMGEYLESTSFQDALVDKTVSILQSTGKVPKTMFREIFKGSIFRSGMRKLLADVAVYSWFAADLEEQKSDEAYVDFFNDVAVALKKRITDSSLSAPYDKKDVGCYYHDHGKHDLCYREVFG